MILSRTIATVLATSLSCLGWLAPTASGQDDWTFLVYMDADNNLESAGINDFLEIADVGSTADVNILVLFDRHPGYTSQYGDWTDTRRGIVDQGDVPNTDWGVSVGELNMGDPNTLIDFVEWGMQNYPATRYAVVLWDHGSGWRRDGSAFKDVCSDSTDGDSLLMAEVRGALNTIESDFEQPDLVGFDACLMGMVEVAYEIREHGNVMVGSEKTEPGDGWPYDTLLEDLVDDPLMSAAELGTIIVYRYHESYGGGEVLSAVDLSRLSDVATRVDVLAQALRTEWDDDTDACAVAAYPVMAAISSSVIAEAHGSSWPGSHGLAVYFPENSWEFNANYNGTTIQFPLDVRWEEFLDDYYTFMTGTWVADVRNLTQEYNNGRHVDLYDFCERIASPVIVIWVNFYYSGIEYGSVYHPFNSLQEAVAAAQGGETIAVVTGTSAETLTISKALTLRAYGGPVSIGVLP